MRTEPLERDEQDHLLSLSVENQMHESLIFTHWEAEHCPAGTVARIKAACPYFDRDRIACPVSLTAALHCLNRHLRNIHGVGEQDMALYNLQSRCSKVNKSMPKRTSFVTVSAEELTTQFMRGMASGTALWPVTGCLAKTKSRRGRRTTLECYTSHRLMRSGGGWVSARAQWGITPAVREG